jgi:hypothetical protein
MANMDLTRMPPLLEAVPQSVAPPSGDRVQSATRGARSIADRAGFPVIAASFTTSGGADE